jgi:hypothetical protein
MVPQMRLLRCHELIAAAALLTLTAGGGGAGSNT